MGEEQKLIFVFNFGSRSIPWLVFFLDHIINFSKLIDAILIIGLDNEHAALDKALPVLAIRMQGSGHFKNIDGLIKLVVIDVELNQDLEGFLRKDRRLLPLQLDAVLEVEDGLLFALEFQVAEA